MKKIISILLFTLMVCQLEAQHFSIPENNSVYAGFRASRLYHIYPDHQFPSKEYWLKVGIGMADKFDNASPAGIWIVGLYQSSGEVALGFPSPGGTYDKITFSGSDLNEDYLDHFDENNLKVWLQVEPGSANIDTLIHLVMSRYQHHPCVIGFGIDVEWYRADGYPEGAKVSNEKAEHWEEVLHAMDTTWSLFLKHYNTDWMPPDYRGDIFFVDDSQDFNWADDHFQLMIDEYKDWGATFSPNASGFQFGYPADKNWWSEFADPPKTIGQALIDNIPECKGVFWVDFTVTEIFPLGINEHLYRNDLLKYAIVFPNPVTARSKIVFRLEDGGEVSILLTNTSGKATEIMTGQYFSNGEHRIALKTADLSPGIYFLILRIKDETITTKFVIPSGK